MNAVVGERCAIECSPGLLKIREDMIEGRRIKLEHCDELRPGTATTN